MKHLLLLSLFTAFLWACHKDQDPAPKTQVELLPPATQEGKRTFGCLIDGKAWTPKAGFVPPPISVSYDEITGALIISARRNIGIDGLSQSVNFFSTARSTGAFVLPIAKSSIIDTSSFCTAQPFGYINGIGLNVFENYSEGGLFITKLDLATGIISGTFEYDAYSPECNDTVRITEGRFDVRYKYQ